MGVPARVSAAAQELADPERKPDPRARGWAEVRQTAIATILASGSVLNLLARYPDDSDVQSAAGRIAVALENVTEIGRRWVLDEKTLEAERAQAYAEGAADCKAARCRLGVVPD